ncbi:hypothetical protein Pmi06nite_76430 [Planotetraspora mira]|uniref:Uncharacterized protein n=1 Tax=Planotetraspora mira TaxID=58121 RepID=A0A8J3TYE6_9ACTN|nr:hypothetical protein Pmi06nite_76430 [Planotetraspora mira]
MRAKEIDDEPGKRHFPPSCAGLGVWLDGDVTVDLYSDLEHSHRPGIEVERIPAQARTLTPAQTGPSCQRDYRLVETPERPSPGSSRRPGVSVGRRRNR